MSPKQRAVDHDVKALIVDFVSLLVTSQNWSSEYGHMVETEALFRQQEVLGPLCSGPETRIILFLQFQLNV